MRTPLPALGLAALASSLLTPQGSAATLQVPSQYPTVQAALDAAANGDTVLVAPGTYTGAGNRDLDPQGKAITLTSSAGAAATILDVQGSAAQPHRGLILTSGGAFLVIDGFTIKNGHHASGGGVLIQGTVSAKLRNLVVEQCVADGAGGGIHVLGGGGPTIEQCVVRFNQAAEGAGVEIDGQSAVSMTDCEVADNAASVQGGGLRLSALFAPPGTTFLSLAGCDFDRNTAPDVGGGVVLRGEATVSAVDCRFRDNVTAGGFPQWGGGMLVEFGADVTLTDCELSGNAAGGGGGLFLQQDGVAHLVDCDVLSNHANDAGGGIAMNGQGTPLVTTLEMDGCLVEGNTAASSGAGLGIVGPVTARVRTSTFRANAVGPLFPEWAGGIMASFSCDAVFEDCVIEQNQADAGAGLFVQQDAQVVVRRCTFRDNAAKGVGGGVHMNGQGTPFVTSLHVVDSLLEGNTAEDRGAGFSAFGEITATLERTCLVANQVGSGSPQLGGGLHAEFSSDIALVDCELRENVANQGGGASATASATLSFTGSTLVDNLAFADGAGLYVSSGAAVALARTTVASNAAGGAGGGVAVSGAQLDAASCLVVSNSAPIGGGLRAQSGGTANLVNVTVAGNTGTFAGGLSEGGATVSMTGCVVYGNAPPTLQQTGGVTATYSDLESGLAGAGNLSIDPAFVDPSGGDHRLSAGSPCIDAADNGANPGPLDLEGAPRFFDDPGVPDTGVGPAPVADMGAHETYAVGPFHPYGEGCAGSSAAAPRLRVSGDPSPGGTITLRIDKARGGSSAFLLLGLGAGATPIGAGCTLHLMPVLPAAIGPLPLPGTPSAGFGAFELPVLLPPAATQASVTLQAFVGDPGSPLGFGVSNGFVLGLL